MNQVNMLEAKTELSKLIKLLETHEEEVIYIARGGDPVAMLTLIPPQVKSKRIGIAKGKFTIPDDFDIWDNEIEEMFGEEL